MLRTDIEMEKAAKKDIGIKDFALLSTTGILGNYQECELTHIYLVNRKTHNMHPFREGNGRTQREFVRILALEKGYAFNLNPPDDCDVYERYMSGTIDGDIEKLPLLIEERLYLCSCLKILKSTVP
jgi:cell filamentation protein